MKWYSLKYFLFLCETAVLIFNLISSYTNMANESSLENFGTTCFDNEIARIILIIKTYRLTHVYRGMDDSITESLEGFFLSNSLHF